MRKKSRLSRSSENKQKKTIFLSFLGIVVLLIILFKFGLPVLINFSLFIAGNKNTTSSGSETTISYISPPNLNTLPQGTKEKQIKISGSSQKGLDIELYLNGKKIKDLSTDSDGEFFTEAYLKEGENTFRARAVKENKKSEFSESVSIIYKNSPPSLEITSPSDGTIFKREDKFIEVKGKTDPNTTITVNGFYAVIDESNNYSYSLGLHEGENEIKVEAVDVAGNKTEQMIKVSYSQ